MSSVSEPPPEGTDPLIGSVQADRYLIERRLGEGGMGAVYLARHIVLEKQVALKILHPEYSRRKDLVERFLHEARAAARIRHANVIDITDFGQTDIGTVFFAMELLEGSDLAELVRSGALDWRRTRAIALQICAAVQAAHDAGIIHRDLKPENIFLIDRPGQRDFVKVLDFGIAKLTELEESGRKLTKTGMVFGTPEYMAPEQARGEKSDGRVDVYAMGCILYQLVTGEVPFRADSFMGVLTKHLFEPVPPLTEAIRRGAAPAGVEAILLGALEKDPTKRISDMNELGAALAALDGGEPGEYHPPVRRASEPRFGATPLPPPMVDPTSAPPPSVEVQLPASVSTPSAAPPRPRTGLFVAAAVLVVAGGVAIVLATRRGAGPSDAPSPGAGQVRPAPAPAAPPTPPPVAPPAEPPAVAPAAALPPDAGAAATAVEPPPTDDRSSTRGSRGSRKPEPAATTAPPPEPKEPVKPPADPVKPPPSDPPTKKPASDLKDPFAK